MYELTWITEQLATGHAPMSYAELDSIREQGITAIVNLCGEYCDLHQIEEQSGFEVYYLPVPDECAPDLEAMEQALEWLDEATYLQKKVLVHCRHGFGRTGTFVSAYLLRRGLGMKMTERALKGNRAKPTNYSQWRLLRKYGKKSGRLAAAQPTIDNRPTLDLSPFLDEFQSLVEAVDRQLPAAFAGQCCGAEQDACCSEPFDLSLIESIALSQALNRTLKRAQRDGVIELATRQAAVLRSVHHGHPEASPEVFSSRCREAGYRCPLNEEGQCLVHADRPLRCRSWNNPVDQQVLAALADISRQLFLGLTGAFAPGTGLRFTLPDTVSGRFVQVYFQAMLGEGPGGQDGT